MSAVDPIPKGQHSVQPYMFFKSSEAAIAFYVKAFAATEELCMRGPDGRVTHASIRIGDSIVMMSDENEAMGAYSAEHFSGSPINLMVYTPDCDGMYKNAVAAGATSLSELKDQPHGDRMCAVRDPFGYTWYLATHLFDVTTEDLQNMYAR